MALLKTTPWKFGLNITYWMIADVQIMKIENITRINIVGYIDKSLRLLDVANTCKCISMDFIGINYSFEQLYEKIKENTIDEEGNEILSFFNDAIDEL